jgi:putative endonuclease
MKYIYILNSAKSPDQLYSGMTDQLEQVLTKHNGRQVAETSKHAPWNLRTYIAFADESKARAFDNYLKSDEGIAFIKRRF